jgi:ABC-type uncharacterized transport system substrate-binding protein
MKKTLQTHDYRYNPIIVEIAAKNKRELIRAEAEWAIDHLDLPREIMYFDKIENLSEPAKKLIAKADSLLREIQEMFWEIHRLYDQNISCKDPDKIKFNNIKATQLAKKSEQKNIRFQKLLKNSAKVEIRG